MLNFLTSIFSVNNLKTYLIVFALIFAVNFYKDYVFQKSENTRQTENISQIRKSDSLKFAAQVYTKKELSEYLEYNRKDLQSFLKANKVSTKRIEKIISQQLNYKDTVIRSVNLQPILDAINTKKNIRIPIIDSTNCMTIKGFVSFKNDSLDLKITDRNFTNRTDVVSYWQRKKWSFLGIKTRLFGKKESTVIIKDKCGNTETFTVEKKKK